MVQVALVYQARAGGRAGQVVVVDDDEVAVEGGMDVELDGIGAELAGGAKGRHGVLGELRGRSPVGVNARWAAPFSVDHEKILAPELTVEPARGRVFASRAVAQLG